jgi:hypothetical protein
LGNRPSRYDVFGCYVYIATSVAIAVDESYGSGSPSESLYLMRDASAQVFFIASFSFQGAVALRPAPTGQTAQTPRKTIDIPKSRFPAAYEHIIDSQISGRPAMVQVQRTGAVGRRAAALRGVPRVRGTDRDEYPPAITAQGGAGSTIRHIPPADNRGAGAYLGNQLRDVRDGEWIVIRPVNDTGS